MTGRYVKLSSSAWKERLAEIKRLASVCELCPRCCGVNRLSGERGNCGAGSLPSLVSYVRTMAKKRVCLDGGGPAPYFLAIAIFTAFTTRTRT